MHLAGCKIRSNFIIVTLFCINPIIIACVSHWEHNLGKSVPALVYLTLYITASLEIFHVWPIKSAIERRKGFALIELSYMVPSDRLGRTFLTPSRHRIIFNDTSFVSIVIFSQVFFLDLVPKVLPVKEEDGEYGNYINEDVSSKVDQVDQEVVC